MKTFFLIVFIISSHLIFSQNDSEKISLEYNNLTKIEIIKRIEVLTNYHFYFIEDWFDNKRYTGKYDNITLIALLDDLFKDTILNYHILQKNKVILTQSVLIYDSLPESFFHETKTEATDYKKLNSQLITEDLSEKGGSIKTIRIGKENKNSKQVNYTLSGYIKDSKSGRPLADIVLVIKSKNINTITNSKGFYSFEIPSGTNYIETKALGMQDSRKKVIIYNNGTLNFTLNESAELLDEIIIEADKEKNIKEAISGITRIKIKDIKNIPLVLGVRDILQVATALPGVSKTGEGSSGYNVRGGKEDQNLILLDNGVIYNPTHLFGIFSALNPFTSGEAKIYKGNIPAEFGGRLSSVFDISTKEINDQKFSGEASIGPVTSNLSLEIPILKDKSALLIGGRGTYSDWVLKALDDESLKNSKASFYDVIVKYNHKINENNNLKATGYLSRDEFSITSDSLFSYENRMMSINWNHHFNKKNKLNLIVSNSEYRFDIAFDNNSNKGFDLGYKVNETELKFKFKYLFNDKHHFNYGVSSKLYVVNPGSKTPKGNQSLIETLTIPKEKALESALFISDDFKINDNLSLSAGIRYSMYASLGEISQRTFIEGLPKNEGTILDTLNFKKNEVVKTYGGPEFRTSMRYTLSSNSSIKASFNSTYQYIHTLSTNTTVSPTDTWKLSDLNIKPQRATQYTLGFYKNLDGNTYQLSLEGYYKRSKNILDYKIGADLLINKSIETEVLQGLGKAYGVEFLVKKTKGKLNGWLGYTYSRSFIKFDSEFGEERINNGNFFPANFDKPHDVSIVTNYKLTKRFSLSANFTYQTGRPITYPVGTYIFDGAEYPFFSNRNEFRIPDYYRLDLGLNIEGNHKIKKFAHSFWNISVYNVLGRNNPYSVFFVSENNELKAYQSSIFSIPIPTITYNFKF